MDLRALPVTFQLIFVLCFITHEILRGHCSGSKIGKLFSEVQKERGEVSEKQKSCFGCQGKDSVYIRSQYRLQKIKERIQNALGIEDDPPPSSNDTTKNLLPAPIQDKDESILGEDENSELKKERQILLAETTHSSGGSGTGHFKFKMSLSSDMLESKLSTVELWLPMSFLRMSYSLTVKTVLRGTTLHPLTRPVRKDGLNIAVKKNGWIALSLEIELTSYVKNYVQGVLGVDGAEMMVDLEFTDAKSEVFEARHRPFIVQEISKKVLKRKRRAAECKRGRRCCRVELTVKFADIGLGTHVIEPREFEAYQCLGKCGSFSRSTSTRVEIIKSVIGRMRQRNENTDHITFCCTATRSSPQKLIYYSNDKTKILVRNIEGLIVEECDCL